MPFTSQPLPTAVKNEMIAYKTWTPACPISLERLSLLTLSYYDFENTEHHDGEMVVLDSVAPSVLNIFRRLYRMRFPIAKIKRIEAYKGSDDKSMGDNNTSCFNCRQITGGGPPSIHSYGLAIDVNPYQNPYIMPQEDGTAKISPPLGGAYLNRTNLRAGMVESIVDLFKNGGFFIWGGGWNQPIDWQHFQASRPVASVLSAITSQDGIWFLDRVREDSVGVESILKGEGIDRVIGMYRSDSDRFFSLFR